MVETKISGIDSEIAFTALLATGVAAYPVSSIKFYSVFKLLAIGLLLLTLIRRMAVAQDISTNDTLIRKSTYILDPATYISILYLVYVIVDEISTVFGADEVDPFLFGISASIIVVLCFLLWELIFHTVLQEGERSIDATADEHRGELIGILFSRIARFAQSERVYGLEYTTQTEINRYAGDDRDIEDLTSEEVITFLRNIVMTFIALIFTVGSYLLLIPISEYLFSGGWGTSILLLLSVVVTSGFVRLWYSTYGLVKVEDRNGFFTFGGDAVTYIFLSWVMLS